MYFYVVLTKSKKQLIVPAHRILGFNVSASMNFGLNKKVDHLVFYSPDQNIDPVFTAQVQSNFDEAKDACYLARIVRCFGKKKSKY